MIRQVACVVGKPRQVILSHRSRLGEVDEIVLAMVLRRERLRGRVRERHIDRHDTKTIVVRH